MPVIDVLRRQLEDAPQSGSAEKGHLKIVERVAEARASFLS